MMMVVPKMNDKIKVIIAVTQSGDPLILDIPLRRSEMLLLDNDLFLKTKQFNNIAIVPKEIGMYELECELIRYYDNNALPKRIKPNLIFNILKAKSLYKVS
jgi:hypothetical protein